MNYNNFSLFDFIFCVQNTLLKSTCVTVGLVHNNRSC